MQRVPRLTAALLAIALTAFGWAAVVMATGGFDTAVFGVPVRSHDVRRPMEVGLAAMALFVWAYGVRRLSTNVSAWLREPTVPERPVVTALAVGVLLFGLVKGTGVAGGSDSYGYISQADLWLHGLPIVPQPWAAQVPWPDGERTFMPLGYLVIRSGGAIVPAYAIGLPLLMAAVKFVAGHAAIFWIAPAAGAMLVLVTYRAGSVVDSGRTGLVAAFLVAISAPLIAEVTSPMSDVVAAAALSGSMGVLLRGTSHGPASAGALAALAVLVRPNLAPTVVLVALWLATRRSHVAARHQGRLARTFWYVGAAAPGFVITAWANWRFFGSPMTSGYGTFGSIYDWSNVRVNVQAYTLLLVRWRAALAFLGFAALLVPARRLWPRVEDRSVLVGIAVFVFSIVAQYLAYEPATGPGYLRFLLPCWPFVMIGAARAMMLISVRGWVGFAVATIVIAYSAAGVQRTCGIGACDPRGERRYPAVAQIVRAHTEARSVVYAFQHSGSLRYYGGHMTLRFDLLDPAWLDRSVEWFAARGVHAYALLDSWEVDEFRRRFAGQQRASQLDVPLFVYRGAAVVHVYDLLRAENQREPTRFVIDAFDGPRYPRPVPPQAGAPF